MLTLAYSLSTQCYAILKGLIIYIITCNQGFFLHREIVCTLKRGLSHPPKENHRRQNDE